jgi:putative ABC transport system permease protein
MNPVIKELRYAVRTLARKPSFTAIAVLTLALGIGSSTAIFSVVDGVLLKSLPYPEADRLVQLREVNSTGGTMAFAEPNFLDVRSRNRTLEGVAQYNGELTTILGANEPVRTLTIAVSADFFNVLAVKPLLGRTFDTSETKPGGAPVAVVSYGFWQRLLGGRTDLSGTTLRLMDQSFNVVGVMPAGFEFPRNAEVWVPRELFPAETSRSAHNWSVVARMRSAVTAEQARSEVRTIGQQLRQEFGKDLNSVEFTAIPQQEYMVGRVRSPLIMILVAVGLLLAVSCANVANLLLAQTTTRQKDFAVRTALGATRFRLARQLITENLLLALVAGALGVVLALWGVDLLLSLNNASLPRINEIGVNWRVLIFTSGLSLLVAMVLGLVPLLRLSTKELDASLRDSGKGTHGHAGQRMRGILVIGQMALTLILLVAAGLLGKSFYRLLQVDPGFRTESAVAMELSLPNPRMDEERYKLFMEAYKRLMEQGVAPEVSIKLSPEEERQRLFHIQLLERLSSTPGVNAVGSISNLPLSGGGPDGTFLVNNNPARKGNADYRQASPGYFDAMKIPPLRGRTFNRGDSANSPNVAVVSESLVKKYWPNEEPIGQTIQFGNMDGDLRLLHIVGVVGDVRDYGVDQSTVPIVYANALQRLPSSSYTVVARGQVAPVALVPSMREAVRTLDPQLPLKFQTLDQVFSTSLDRHRFSLVVFSVFGVSALLLAAMGIYGVTSYAVAQRTQEIGIRMALGAQMRDVLRLVLSKSMSLVLIGTVIGLLGAFATTRMVSSMLFGVTPTDLAIFIGVPFLLLAVAFVACLLPARRATKVNPLVALRYE